MLTKLLVVAAAVHGFAPLQRCARRSALRAVPPMPAELTDFGCDETLWKGLPLGAHRDLARFVETGKPDLAKARVESMKFVREYLNPDYLDAEWDEASWNEAVQTSEKVAEAQAAIAKKEAKAAKLAAAKAKNAAEKAAKEAEAAAPAKEAAPDVAAAAPAGPETAATTAKWAWSGPVFD